MGTPPCESGFMKVTVAKRWETAESRTEYGFDGTSEMIYNTFQTYNYFHLNALSYRWTPFLAAGVNDES